MISNEFEYLKFKMGKEHLPDVFGTEINTFDNIHNPNVSGSIMLYEWLDKIKYNFDFIPNKYVGDIKNPAYEEIKKKKQATCYNATFDSYKKGENLESITNLMFLDLDGFSTMHHAECCKNYFLDKNIGNGYDWIISCNLSLSKRGLHFIILVDEIIDSKDYSKKYDFINKTYFEFKLDSYAKSLTQYSIVGSDYNIYINENPSILNISEQIKKDEAKRITKKVISVKKTKYDNHDQLMQYDDHVDSTNKKSIRSDEEERIMTTPYTFSSQTLGNSFSYNTTRSVNLKFEETIPDIQFHNPDEPLYFRDGKEIIKINIFPLLNRNVGEGSRTVTLGAITMKMIYLNITNTTYSKIQIKEAILKYMVWLNKRICDPPLSYPEVVNSFNSNWTKYLNNDLDVGELTEIKRSFWSPECKLEPNEKRSISCTLYYEPIVAEYRNKIVDAIEEVHASGVKVTQMEVAKKAGINVQTVKKYWSEYESLLDRYRIEWKNKHN